MLLVNTNPYVGRLLWGTHQRHHTHLGCAAQDRWPLDNIWGTFAATVNCRPGYCLWTPCPLAPPLRLTIHPWNGVAVSSWRTIRGTIYVGWLFTTSCFLLIGPPPWCDPNSLRWDPGMGPPTLLMVRPPVMGLSSPLVGVRNGPRPLF